MADGNDSAASTRTGIAALAHRSRRLLPTLVEYARNEVRDTRPTVLVLAPASRCNAACTFCLDFKRQPQRTMSLANFRRVLDKLAPHLTMVDFSYYGEPLLNAELPDLLAEARARGLGTILYTNGMLLDADARTSLAASGVEIVVINLNAWMEDYRVRDAAALPEKRVEQVNRFIEACMPRTLVALQVIAPAGDRSLDRRALDRRFVQPGNRLLRIKTEERFSYDRETDENGPVRCFRPFEEIAIGPDGEVAVCCKDMERRTTFGNLVDEDLDTIWVERMNVLRRDNRAALCVRCEARSDPRRFVANTLFTPIRARELYLRAGSLWFRRSAG